VRALPAEKDISSSRVESKSKAELEDEQRNTLFSLAEPAWSSLRRETRQRRQVIIVTRNPNLAVMCDADQIIHSHIDKQHKNKVTYSGPLAGRSGAGRPSERAGFQFLAPDHDTALRAVEV
jgi:hypothetical protein